MEKDFDVIFVNAPNHATFPHFPIGIGYLNEILKSDNIKTNIIDIQNMIINKKLEFGQSILKDIETILKDNHANIFIFSIMNSTYIWAIYIIKIVKKYNPDSKIIIGGSHATLLKDQLLIEHKEIDIVCIYEGEQIISDLVKSLLCKDYDLLSNIKNIYYRDKNNTIKFNGENTLLENLDILPIIDYDMNEYSNKASISLDVGRGCPHNCKFCVTKTIWKRTPRYKSSKKIVEESIVYFNKLKENKSKIVLYEHDNFIFNKDILKEIISIKNTLNKKYYYGCSGELNDIDDEVIELLHKSGCKYIFIGIESGSKHIQKEMKKNLNLNDVEEKISKLNKKNITVEVNFIIGFKEEKIIDLINSYRLMYIIKFLNPVLNKVNFTMLSPEPTSIVAESLSEDEFILDTKSIYCENFKNVPIDINKFNKRFINHLFIVKNPNYDIEKIRDFSKMYIEILNNFTITLFILINKYNFKLEEFLDANLEIAHYDETSIISVLEKYVLNKNIDLLTLDIFRYEKLRYQYKNKIEINSNELKFNYDIKNIYIKSIKNPYILFKDFPDVSLI
ncbi:radical SAM protein (plasmid) [Paraclostridium bifermentans]|uniref:Radical SAM protein n=1 Tax=Paraclostridium bifermentans TaxID=1490 RepID=A0A5P3XKH0_PARBF|nr:radical SAM protein [Paraclostridium bifermentans]QEZ70830.1 radical SAM protein [Paraclostridium bifermentans]